MEKVSSRDFWWVGIISVFLMLISKDILTNIGFFMISLGCLLFYIGKVKKENIEQKVAEFRYFKNLEKVLMKVLKK